MANEIDIDIGTFNLDETNKVAINDINIRISKKLSQSKIPKQEGSIIPVAKRAEIDIALSGTIIGTDYDNLRANLDNLKAAFESEAEQKLTLDDDRFIMVQYKDFSYSYETLRTFSKFSVTVVASYPLWLSETLSSDERVPTSGVGYTINNPGNAPTRLKVTITAPAGGISDDCVLENTTKNDLMKYRGTIAAGKSLIVNDRMDQDDQTVTNDGVEDWANFEGDFLSLDPGDNTIKFTGTSGSTVKLEFRGAWY